MSNIYLSIDYLLIMTHKRKFGIFLTTAVSQIFSEQNSQHPIKVSVIQKYNLRLTKHAVTLNYVGFFQKT